MNEKIYQKISCPLCNSEKYSLFIDLPDKKPPYKMVKCSKCLTVYMNPKIRDEYLDNIYSDEKYYTGGIDYTYSDERKEERSKTIINNAILESIEIYVKKGNIIEVGCSFGNLLKTAKRRGWEIYGIDVSKVAIKHLDKQKIPCFNGRIEDCKLKEDNFDAIIMIETIEHISTPVKTLNKCYKLLKKGGLLAIQTGNVDSLFAKILGKKNNYLLPGHLIYYSDKTLIEALRNAGFKKFHTFAGDNIRYKERIRSIINSNEGIKIIEIIKWSIFYTLRKIFMNKPILGSITVYAIK